MAKKKSAEAGIADALLAAHVRFAMEEQLDGAGLKASVERLVDGALEDAALLKLNQVTNAARITQTALTYASDLTPKGDLPALVGDIVRGLYAHPLHRKTHLKDLISDRRFGEFLDKILELKELREHLIRAAAENPLFASLITDLIYGGVRAYLAAGAEAVKLPGADSVRRLGKAFMGRASGLEAAVEERVRERISRSVSGVTHGAVDAFLEHADDAVLRAAAENIWDEAKTLPLHALQGGISARDLEELLAIGYDYWRELSQTPYYRDLIAAGIAEFFKVYGGKTLLELLDDLGVTRELMIAEAMRHAPGAIKAMRESGVLEKTLTRQLEPFYRSKAFAAATAAYK